MKKNILILLVLVTSLFSSNVKVKNILVLHTYDYQYPWTKSLFAGMDTIQKESLIPIKFYTEQIDFKKIELKNRDKWVNYFSNKYKNIALDGIVVVFGNAIEFINEYGNIIFKDIPKVVYGDKKVKNDPKAVFMRIENASAVEETVQEALSQNKSLKNIYILGNAGELTLQLKALTKKYVKRHSSLNPIEIPNVSSSKIENFLRKIPKDSIVFYCLFFKDKDGIKLSPNKYLQKFARVSNAPIYSYYSVLVGNGSVGGYVIDINLLTQNMVKVLIHGKKEITNTTYSIRPIFDYSVLEKYNIDVNDISKEALILNKPISYLKIYKEDILITILIILFLILIISVLINRKRKKKLLLELKTKNKLLYMKEEFNSFFELSINLQLIANANDGKIVQINNASKSILGYSSEELVGTTFLDLIHKDDIEATINEMKKLSDGQNVYFFENRYKHKNGTYINLAWSATTNAHKKLIYATAQNITQSKLLEKEKKDKEQMLYQQSKLAAMGEMLGNIAHQWRQPLSVISTAATGANFQKELGSLSDAQLTSLLASINDSAQYLSATIDDFRSFFDPNNNVLNKFNMSSPIEKALTLVNAQFKAKEIELIKDIKDYEILSIENELIQVLINILNNARDALIAKNKNKRLIFINTYKKDNFSYIEIVDNAGGIEIDIIDKIFEPYFTTKHKSQGTGIGLYMSEEIVKNHLNGIISAENSSYTYDGTEYKGAKFIIKMAQDSK